MGQLSSGAAEAWAAIERFARAFWHAATDPLAHLSIETGILFALLVLLVWLVTLFVGTATWRFSRPKIQTSTVMTTHHFSDGALGLSPEDYIRALAWRPADVLERNPTRAARIRWCEAREKKERFSYFVVTIVERESATNRIVGRPVLFRELRLWRKTKPLSESFIHLDASCLREVREHNQSGYDDEDGTEVAGTYDVYIRRVGLFDVRHWLVHPNREIRIAVWVTLISIFVPPIIEAILPK